MTVSAADSQKQRGQTQYQVLMLVEFPDPTDGTITAGWMELSTPIKAANAEAAIRAKAPTEGTRKLVAVPARSWKPVTVSVSQTTVVKVGEPT